MRVFVLSSDHEGMPNAVLEAAASGMLIVATAVDGAKDLLTHGLSALLVAPGDRPALTEAITALLTDETLARTLGRTARAAVHRLTPAIERDHYVALYARLVAPAVRSGDAATRAH
jgi:glycosyltransferase involved in cell wall biosynthesis